MSLFLFQIEEIGGPGIVLKNLNTLKKKVFMLMGIFWHDNLRQKHFTKAGAREYKYAPRRGDRGNIGRKGFRHTYQARKLRTKGHTRPLVYSGESEGRTRVRDVRSTSKGVRVVLNVPTLNLKNPLTKIDMRQEMTVISDREVPLLVEVGERELDRGINAFEGKIVTKRF